MFGLGLGRLGASGSGAFSPSSIAGKRLWLRPSVTAGMWQDSAGTTSMSAVGTLLDTSNPVGKILDYSGQGIHLSQSTSTARPVLSARRNLLTKTNTPSDTAWGASGFYFVNGLDAQILGPDGVTMAGAIIEDTTLNYHARGPMIVTGGATPVAIYNKSAYFKYKGRRAGFQFKTSDGVFRNAFFDLQAGTVVSKSGVTSASISDAGNGWWRCSMVIPPGSGGSSSANEAIHITDLIGAAPYTGDGVSGVYVYGVQTTLGADLLPYQPVNTASDYPPVTPQYVKYDGVDDALASATLTAGTLGSNVDAFMVVRRDTAGNVTLGYPTPGATTFFGMAESGSGSVCHASVGTPTVWVNGVQLAGGTSVTRGTLHTALTVGDWHVVEFRNLDLSAWTQIGEGGHTGYLINGAMGERLIADAMPDATRAKVRTYLGKTVGKVL